MFQTLNEELPPMPIEMLKLRSEVWEADGLHLIYNVPRPATDVVRTGPYKPFPGLCIAILMYLPRDRIRFCAQMGTGDKTYMVGWTFDPTRGGMFSLTWINDEWKGIMDASKKTFPKGYVYLYLYFENSNTLHISFQEHDIFEMRAGTVITIRTKFTKCKDTKKTGVAILIGCTTCKEKEAVGYTFAPYNNPEEVYVFRVTITEKGAIIHYTDGVVHLDMDYCDGTNEKCRAFLALECAKPLHIQVETMGQTW